MDAFETITCAIEGPLATVTLNRPEARNALSLAMVLELLRCFTELSEDTYRDVRVVVLRAAGETFCAGGDLRDMSAASEGGAGIGARLDDLLRAVNEAPQVVVARIQGAAMGGGLGLVCVSDIAIADEKLDLWPARGAAGHRSSSDLALCDPARWLHARTPTHAHR